ncbi:hypothetical protein [Sinorhizobium fredii]|uniref:hypothetical protein n=1 Tax=Rhizobium fredii TaxID=380 RepID=UPI00056CE61B|nr:hypothetical protein [Sinorhizobium fredii]
MSLTTDFIAELIRAANDPDKLSPFVVTRLLNRCISTIRDMREQTGGSRSNRTKDVLIDLQAAVARAEDLTSDEIRDALVDAADLIRTLKIMLDDNR